MAALAKAIGDTKGRVLFSTLDVVRTHGLLGPVFHEEPGDAGVSLSKVSCRAVFTAREQLTCKLLKLGGLARSSHALLGRSKEREEVMAKPGIADEVQVLRFFESGPIEKA